MGNFNGGFLSSMWTFPHKRGNPDPRIEPLYEPLFGFPRGRKPRLMVATVEEMDSAVIQPCYRDYCAHKLIKLRACKAKNQFFPGVFQCRSYRHAVDECLYQDSLLRMKEYERERRLTLRQERIKKQMRARGELEE